MNDTLLIHPEINVTNDHYDALMLAHTILHASHKAIIDNTPYDVSRIICHAKLYIGRQIADYLKGAIL